MTIRACRWAALGVGLVTLTAWAQPSSPRAKLGTPNASAPETAPVETPRSSAPGKIGLPMGSGSRVENVLPELPALPLTDGPALFADRPRPPAATATPKSGNSLPTVTDTPEESPVVSSALQGKPYSNDSDDSFPFFIQLTPPGPQRLFRLESEEALRERIKLESKTSRLKVDFPRTTEYAPYPTLPQRAFPQLIATAEPNYVCYRRLWFEQRNFERYGWDLGVIQPGISAGLFYADVAAFPLHLILDPLRWWDCSSGLCLPGDPVALRVYPPGSK